MPGWSSETVTTVSRSAARGPSRLIVPTMILTTQLESSSQATTEAWIQLD